MILDYTEEINIGHFKGVYREHMGYIGPFKGVYRGHEGPFNGVYWDYIWVTEGFRYVPIPTY